MRIYLNLKNWMFCEGIRNFMFSICISTIIRNNQIIGHVATAEKMTQAVTTELWLTANTQC